MRHVIIALCLAGPAMAQTGDQTCPAPPDHSEALASLVAAAGAAPDQASGQAISQQMWALWAEAPDAHAQDLLESAISRREMLDLDGALKAAEALIAYCPDYAEGYNQRAFAHFLKSDYAAALPDLEKTLALNELHVAALTGQALTLMALERKGEAALVLRRALKLNPWLGERSLLAVLEAAEEEL